MICGIAMAMDTQSCPSCNATTVLEGRFVPSGDRGAVGFAPLGGTALAWRVGVELPGNFYWCSTCGLVWAKFPPERLRKYVRERCGALAWDYLQALELGPAHDLPDCPDARRAAEGVAEIDGLVLRGSQPEATRRYRELLPVTWDQAIDEVKHWRDRSRPEKLARFGWSVKPVHAKDGSGAADHPMHDPLLDGS